MLLILLAYLGGVLAILSPCILPVLPFVFARGERGFGRGALTAAPTRSPLPLVESGRLPAYLRNGADPGELPRP